MFRKKQQPDVPARQRRSVASGEQNRVYSYHASRASGALDRERLRPEEVADLGARNSQKRGLTVRRLAVVMALFAVLAVGIYNLLLSPEPSVRFVGSQASQSLLRSAAEYQRATADLLRSSIWNRTKFTVQSDSLADELQKKFPEIQNARVSIPVVGHTVNVSITPITPAMLYQSGGKTYVLNERGRVTGLGTDEAAKNAILVRDSSNASVAIGSQALSQSNITYLLELQHQLAAKNIKITEVELPVGSQSAYVRIDTKPYMIKFSFQEDVVRQAGAFLAAYDHMNQTNTNPSEYVDVRVGERVFFR